MNGFVATVAARIDPTQLDTSTAVSGPHDFAVRIRALRQKRIRVHRISNHVRDDREPPLLSGETRGVTPLICPTGQAEYFLRTGLTANSLICPSGTGFPSSSRTSEQSERDPGSITTNVRVARSWSHSIAYDRHWWLWVPAFAGTTRKFLLFEI